MAALKIGIFLTFLIYFTCVDSWRPSYAVPKAITDACKKTQSKTLANTRYCHKYYECSGEAKYKSCTTLELFSQQSNSCEPFKKVKCGSREKIKLYFITETCKKTKSKILLDTEYCHKYYECSGETQHKTCTYPKLFSEESYSCEDFKKVKCGSRKERKNYCEYYPDCFRCIPCTVEHPNCEGYPDGKNIHSYKGAPYYMVCDTGRLVTQGPCSRIDIIDYSCYDKPCSKNLNTRYGTGHCDSYIWCYYGREFTYRCPAGTVFDKRRGSCQHKYDTCKPCGTKSC